MKFGRTKILLHPKQFLAMLDEEVSDLEMEGEFLVFDGLTHMETKLSKAIERAITNSRPTVVDTGEEGEENGCNQGTDESGEE